MKILLLAVVVLLSGCVSDTITDDAARSAPPEFEELKSSLAAAMESGGISPETYAEVDGKIKNLEETGYVAEAQELRALLARLAVGGETPQEAPQTPPQAATSQIPRLKNLGVNFGPFDASTSRAGDFLFMQGTFEENIIVPFGYLVVNDNGAKRLPELTFIIPEGTPVVSPIDGIADDISVIDWSKDYAIQLKTSRGDEWMVGFEHLINLRVSEGDVVTAGQIVGEAAPWNSGTGFAELVVWKGGQQIVKHCPFDALEENLKPVYAEKIGRIVADWEKYKGKNIYQEETWALPGCLMLEMTETEAMNPVTDNIFQATGFVRWEYVDNTAWVPRGTPPECPALGFDPPADVSKATSVLYPGQYRGSDFKPHGGLRFDNQGNNIEIRAPFDAYLIDGVRYSESGEIQYMFDFMDECGIMYRLDHLLELSPALKTVAEKLPPPKPGDTRTTAIEPLLVGKGDLIATKVGVTGNVFFDWGVYDLRKENDASKNPSFRAAHDDERGQAFHALCWLNYLKEPYKTTVKNLPGSGPEGKTSDYC